MRYRFCIVLALLSAILLTLAGCGQGMALSSSERQEKHRRIREYDRRQFNDDWDLFWLNDDVSRMSMWRIR